jgi:hypothetical protein
MSADEFQKSLNKIRQLEGLETKLEKMAGATTDAGTSAGAASPLVSRLGGDMKKAGDEATDVGEKSKGGFLKMATAVAAGQAAVNIATAAIGAAFSAVKGSIDEFGAALDLGGRLSDLSGRTGEAAGNLLLLERAFDNSGAGAEKVGPAINKLQKFIEDAGSGASAQVEVMSRLGLTLGELAGKTPTEQMQTFAQKISSIEDPGKRAALAMEVFGRAGGELLPLLTNFSGEIGTAQGQLGGMVDVMNRNAETFDAVSDKVDTIGGKFMEFAAGVLDKVAPALDAVTEALSRIDAAAIGQKFADMFTGGLSAMKGFQASVDAFKTGNIEGALSLLWESIKLQAMQTANAIYQNLVAAFKTVGDVISAIFSSDSATMKLIETSFFIIGQKAAMAFGSAMLSVLPNIKMFESVRENLEENLEKMKGAQHHNFRAMKEDATAALGEIGHVMGQAPEVFKTNLAGAGVIFTGLEAQAAALATKQTEVATAAGTTNQALQAQIPTMQELVAQQQHAQALELAKLESAADVAEAKFTEVENQIALNNAIATGNTSEQERLQNLIAGEAQQKRINTLVLEYAKLMPQAEAGNLAKEMVRSETAAQKAKSHADGLKTNLTNAATEAGTVQEAVKKIAQEKMDNSAKALNAALVESRTKLGEMKDFIGVDMSQMSIEDIIKKLGLDVDIMATQETKIKAINAAVKAIADMPVTDVTPTVDEIGVNNKLQAVQTALANINAPTVTPAIGSVSNGVATANTELDGINTPDVTPSINESDLQSAVANANKALKGISAETIIIDLDASASIASIRSELASPITMDLQGGTDNSAAGGLLGEIKSLVDVIRGVVEKIESKLPITALA